MTDTEGLHLMRVTIEATSPISIGSMESEIEAVAGEIESADGKSEKRQVTVPALIRGPSGLPAVPAASLRGGLRDLAERHENKEFVKTYFGFAGRNHTGAASLISFGWGHAHDSEDQCYRGATLPPEGDTFLKILHQAKPLVRDHVAINQFGVVDGRGKFMRAAVPVGTRFSFEFSANGEESGAVKDALIALLHLMACRDLTLGWGTSRGYGGARLVRASHQWFSYDESGIHALFTARLEPQSTPLSRKLDLPDAWHEGQLREFEIETEDFIRVGGRADGAKCFIDSEDGTRSARDIKPWPGFVDDGSGRDNTLTLLAEPTFRWSGKERVVTRFSLPGSAVKGPLAHRTLYWWNKLSGQTIDPDDPRSLEKLDEFSRRDATLQAMFGAIKETAVKGGRRSALDVEESSFDADYIAKQDHVSIDRFTSGPRDRDGALFSEELLFDASAKLAFRLRKPKDIEEPDWHLAVKALDLAIRDLAEGRLSLGGRGHGTMQLAENTTAPIFGAESERGASS
jgi:CRISPR/Cas system CSM-associated protein Csm3 (group 7 of RAMP superfamily)